MVAIGWRKRGGSKPLKFTQGKHMSIEAMKQALEALELALRNHGVMLLSDPPQDAWKTYGVESNARQAITALSQAIAKAEKQEPACPHIDEPLGCYRIRCQLGRKCVDAQSQPKREWVGLTDEEIKFEAQYLCNSYYLENPERLLLLVRTIETKLREKNNGT